MSEHKELTKEKELELMAIFRNNHFEMWDCFCHHRGYSSSINKANNLTKFNGGNNGKN